MMIASLCFSVFMRPFFLRADAQSGGNGVRVTSCFGVFTGRKFATEQRTIQIEQQLQKSNQAASRRFDGLNGKSVAKDTPKKLLRPVSMASEFTRRRSFMRQVHGLGAIRPSCSIVFLREFYFTPLATNPSNVG